MLGTVIIKPIQAKLEKSDGPLAHLDPYCVAVIGDQQVTGNTSKNGGAYPIWEESFQIKCTNEAYCYLEIKDKSSPKDKSLGICAVDLSELVKEGNLQKWYGLYCDRRLAGEIEVCAAFIPAAALNSERGQPSVKAPLKELALAKTRNIDLCMPEFNPNRVQNTKAGLLEVPGGSGWKENRDPNKIVHGYHRRGNSVGKPVTYNPHNNIEFFSQRAVKNVQYNPEKDILQALPEAGSTFKLSNTQTLSENIGSLAATRSDLKDIQGDDQREISKANDTQTTLADIVNALDSKPATLEEKLNKPKSAFKPHEGVVEKEIIDEQKRLEEILIKTRGINEVRASIEDEECNILLQSTQLVPNEIAAKEGIHHLPACTTINASHRRFSEDYSSQYTKPVAKSIAKPATSVITIKVSDIKSKFLENVKKGTLMIRDGFNNFTSKKEQTIKQNLFNSHAPYLENNGGNSSVVHNNSPETLKATENKQQKNTGDTEPQKEAPKTTLARLEEKVTDKLHHKDAENVTIQYHSKPSTVETLEHGITTTVNTDRSKNAPTHRLGYSSKKNVEEMPVQIQNHFQMYSGAPTGKNNNEGVRHGPVMNAVNVPGIKAECLTPSKTDRMQDKANEPISPSKQASAEKLIHYKRVGAEEWAQGDSRNDRAFIDDPSSQSDMSRKEITEEKGYFGGMLKEKLNEQKYELQGQLQDVLNNHIESYSPMIKTDTIKPKHFEGALHDRSTKTEPKKVHGLNTARIDHLGSSSKTSNLNTIKRKTKEESESVKILSTKTSARNKEDKISGNHNVLKPVHDNKVGVHKAEGLRPKPVKATIEQVKGKPNDKVVGKSSHNVVEKKEAKNKGQLEHRQPLFADAKKIKNATLKQKFHEGIETLKNKITATEKTPVNEPNHFIPITSILNDREKYHQGGLQWAKNNTGIEDLPVQSKNMEGQQGQIKLPIEHQYRSEEVRKRSSSFENGKQEGIFSSNLKISDKLANTHGPIDTKHFETTGSQIGYKRRNLSIDMPKIFESKVREEMEHVDQPVHFGEAVEKKNEGRESVGKEHNLGSARKLRKEQGRGRSGNLPALESKITKLMQEFFSELNKNNMHDHEGHHGEEVKGREGVYEQNNQENDENYNPNKVLTSSRQGEKAGPKPRTLKW